MAEVQVPRLAESISEAVLVAWLKQDGEAVKVDEPIATLETDKAAVEIPATAAGVLHHARKVGDKVEVGDVIARIEDGAAAAPATPEMPAKPAAAREPAAPAARFDDGHGRDGTDAALSPAVRRMVEEHGLDAARIPASGRGGRLLKEDVQRYLESAGKTAARPAAAASPTVPSSPAPSAPKPPPTPPPVDRTTARLPVPQPQPPVPPRPQPQPEPPAPPRPLPEAPWQEGESERAVPMTRIRQRIAERLLQVQQTAAILTTFNEVDMSAVMELRGRFRESFEQRHGVKLSYMSFFSRACVLALQQMPRMNAEIRGTDIVYKRHVHMGIAVGTDRGLVVPVVSHADQRAFADLEKEIGRLAQAARENRLTLDELSGGTFTISNGGVYGSLLSTPILNPPQSGILGMHKIEKRPIAVDDQVVIRPMMYLALSYDHRIVDGEQAVTFLVSVKERLEDPERMLLDV
jgi:2-oxoglutarate dehydrogenase E2 component (dihydrolipoamide succinyltransferase)